MMFGKKGAQSYVRGAFSYLGGSGDFIWIMVAVFLYGMILGFLLPGSFGFLDSLLAELVMRIEGMNVFELVSYIFFNNAGSAFTGLLFGIFLGIFPIGVALFNGIVLGYVFRGVLEVSGLGEFWRILPHGVFELPAVFISLGLGLRLGMFVFYERKWSELKKRLIHSLIIFLGVVVPLLIIAAFIEGLLIAFSR